jgi:hypothetical protein
MGFKKKSDKSGTSWHHLLMYADMSNVYSFGNGNAGVVLKEYQH